MKYPQTIAQSLAKNMQSIADNACCAFTFMWCLGLDLSDSEAIQTVSDAMTTGALESDCTVKWAEFGKFLTGKIIDVDFKKCTDISRIKERTPVRFDWNGLSHWVGVENGRVAFNSLLNSNCVTKGKPAQMRVIKVR